MPSTEMPPSSHAIAHRVDSAVPGGVALLIAGHGTATRQPYASDAPPLETLGRVGETFLAAGARWRVRRLSGQSGTRFSLSRASLRRQLDELADASPEGVLIALVGEVTTVRGEPALILSDQYRDYPDDSTVPLSWVREGLARASARRAVVTASLRWADASTPPATTAPAAAPARSWLEALSRGGEADVVAVHHSTAGAPLLELLGVGLRGEATDPTTGTVTMASLSAFLANGVEGVSIQRSQARETFLAPPPLLRLWNPPPGSVTAEALAREATRSPAADELCGLVLPGRFRLESVIATGNFGTVYRARQLAVDRTVAVKVLHSTIDPMSDDGRLFIQEIQNIGRIDHPNVVRIYQADLAPNGRLFFAMEFLSGETLHELLEREGTVAPELAVATILQLLSGLSAAHSAGLVHSDVKPANIVTVREAGGAERVVLLDFGLARARLHGAPVESAGGTPQFMAPEQLREWRVDARSDVFSAGLVLLALLTGARRTSAAMLIPSLEGVPDHLRPVLQRALAEKPGDRFPSVSAFAAALDGTAPPAEATGAARPPFRGLSPLSQDDAYALRGRSRAIAALADACLYGRAVIYTAPSGTGKTSLLRAGLLPRLEQLGFTPVYTACRTGVAPFGELATAIAGTKQEARDAGDLQQVIAARPAHERQRLVIVLDQVETLLMESDEGRTALDSLLNLDGFGFADIAIVISVREDFLARLIGGHELTSGLPIIRLGPLNREGARDAIVGPLLRAGVSIEPPLLDEILDDLVEAAGGLSDQMGWSTADAVYPPHLQLCCSILYESLGDKERQITRAHYRSLGGLSAIVGGHLDHVLETELDETDVLAARELFLALVTAANTRKTRSERELLTIVGGQHGADRVRRVLIALHARGLLVPVRVADESAWEFVHDSLVPRVRSWLDRRDLARRNAMELLRHHLRRSTRDSPDLLSRNELRELARHPDAVEALADEVGPGGTNGWTPHALVARSKAFAQRRLTFLLAAFTALAVVAGLAVFRWFAEHELREREASLRRADRERFFAEQSLRFRNLGKFSFVFSAYDWDPDGLSAQPVAMTELPHFDFHLVDGRADDLREPGAPVAPDFFVSGDRWAEGTGLVAEVEARGGPAFLVATGRGRDGARCSPSIIPLRSLPGYTERGQNLRLEVALPTCQASSAGTVEIPAGPFVDGGRGDPPSAQQQNERTVSYVAAFSIDKYEVTNAAHRVFSNMRDLTGVAAPTYPDSVPILARASGDRYPVAYLDWHDARAYCRFMGKRLPETDEWLKAARGGLELAGVPNPWPERNLPWGRDNGDANVPGLRGGSAPYAGPMPVDAFPEDVSPYGVVGMAGNLGEWTNTTRTADGLDYRAVRGGMWDVPESAQAHYVGNENTRFRLHRSFSLGLRCAGDGQGKTGRAETADEG